jgi:hypothetical protein
MTDRKKGSKKTSDAAAAQADAPHPFPFLLIASPIDGEDVGLTFSVRGFAQVEDPSLLSLLVQSHNNGRYYLQGAVRATPEGDNGFIWHADCQFGDPDKPGFDYSVVAVYGAALSLKSFDAIPDGLTASNRVEVTRPGVAAG